MNQTLQKVTKAILFCLIISLFSCEKDLYENTIVPQGKTNFVTIESVPFLIPHISDYQSNYTNKLESKSKTKNLNLNLNEILEYVKEDGVKSYSIEIHNEIQSNEKIYFENLHVAEYNGSYETFILRWTPNDSPKELQTNTFTGELACFDIYYNLKTTMQFVDGKIISTVQVAKNNITGKRKEMIGNCFYEYLTCSCKGELVGAHTCTIGIYVYCSGGGGGSSTGGSGSTNTGSTTGAGGTGPSGGGSGTGSSSGTTTTPPIVVVPNFDTNQNNFIKSLGNVKSNFYALHAFTQTIIFDYLSYAEFQPEPSLTVKQALLKIDLEWLKNQSILDQMTIATYLSNNGFSPTSASFITNMKSLIAQNPSYSWTQIENWFMGTSEGQDGTYNPDYWENPNLTFQKQNLPTLLNFKNAYPSKYSNAGIVCNDIGGNVLVMYNAVIAQNRKLNTCAIRMSRALSYSGVVIPSLPDNPDGTKNSVTGADGKNYFINAKALNAWMKKTFGTNPSNYLHYTASQGGTKGENFPNLLANVKGIYSMVALQSIQSTWGTGHADLLENGGCLLSCHFYDINGDFVPVSYIDIWILN